MTYSRQTIHSRMSEAVDAAARGETSYLLARWQLCVSAHGGCWIRPVAGITTPEELAGFITLFKRCCDAAFPRAVVFDFSGARIMGEQWSLVFDLIHDFAGELGARCRIRCGRDGLSKSVVLSRRPARV